MKWPRSTNRKIYPKKMMKILPPLVLLMSLFFVAGCNEIWSESSIEPSNQSQNTGIDENATSINSELGRKESAPEDHSESLNRDADYRILSWNVESEGADSDVIATQLKELNTNDHYDVLTLVEVMPADLKKFRYALGKHYKYAYSKSGRNDRLEILYNEDKFELVRHFELKEINILNRYRAPLVAHLKDRSNGTEFLVMVNHLARGKAEIRQQQASMLVEWARDQTLPVFALGDYNFDFVFSTRKGNRGFVNMMRDNIWRWVEPGELIDTNWYDNPRAPDGKDDHPESILDFVFLAGPAKTWETASNVIVRDGDFPDDETTSDHRPLELLLSK